MREEAVVLRRQDRQNKFFGHRLDFHHRAPLLAKLAQQGAVRGIDAQREFRLIVG